ncbi:MAG TPA: L-threonylcarbamoyladenylate synthase [Kiritimatiellia bacterium]|nr:L-threonylcarbamoyladenylate synthase [Kiritimatiellia bacterium]
MKTRITRSPRVAAAALRAGGVVAFPTETVYGLGADALNPLAVKAIFRAKGRPSDNPLIVHVADPEMIRLVAARVPSAAKALIAAFFPGPLTVILPRHPDVPREVTAGLDTVGVRWPRHPVAQAFLSACGVPVAAPSANRSGRPSPTTWRAVHQELDGRVEAILCGGASDVGLESTVVDCTCSPPVVLREGAVSLEDLRRVCPRMRAADGRVRHVHAPRSPGMKYRHYAPSARVVLVDGPAAIPANAAERFAYIGLTTRGFPRKPSRTKPCREVQAYARSLFRFFRACEQAGIPEIYCQRVPCAGLGRALMDRLQKAAADHPIGRAASNKARG